MSRAPIAGVRVIEVGGGLAGAYALKLLVDLGADATVLEPPGGCPLRGTTSSSARGEPLFQYLRSGCSSIVIDLSSEAGASRLRHEVSAHDIVIESLPPRRWEELVRRPQVDDSAVGDGRSPSVVVHISAFGQSGPRRDWSASSLTLQAMAGWPRRLAEPGESPCQAGGDIDAYGAGVHAAVAALTAWRSAVRTSISAEADVSMLEVLVGMLPYPTVHAEVAAHAGLDAAPITRSLPGVIATADSWVGINPLNQQGWNDICELMDLSEFRDRLRTVLRDDQLTEAFRSGALAWLADWSGEDIVDLLQTMRVPATRVLDGRGLLEHRHLAERSVFVEQPGGGGFVRPRPPWRFSATPLLDPETAPALGERRTRTADVSIDGRGSARSDAGQRRSSWGGGRTDVSDLPYAGLKVFDLSVYWAGPIITMYLASFGADVVKVESQRRPDPFRYSGSTPAFGRDWWEHGAVWQAANLGKRSLTLDLTTDEGKQLARRFIDDADVLVENFTPRVLDQLGLDPDELRAANPRLIVLRLPAFGLDGPSRDHVAWAPTFEQASGLAHVSGDPRGRPGPPGGCADPLGGMHGLLGLQAAIEHRDRTGEGQVIEMAQLEALLGVTAEQVIAVSSGHEPSGRIGNRHAQLAPHGIYPCHGEDEWLALAVHDDEWPAFATAIGRPDLAADPDLTAPAARRARHDELDASIGRWTSARPAGDAAERLRRLGVTAAVVARADELCDDEQLIARSYFDAVERPATATYRYPGWPMRFTFGPPRPHDRAAPTLGEHSDELFQEVLGLGPAQVQRLRDLGVTGLAPDDDG